MARKRPCSFCQVWFQPDPRVGERQYACSKPDCQTNRRRDKQAEWRQQNPDYFVARRWSAATASEDAPVPRTPPPLDQVPWDLVQSQFKGQQTVILGLFGRVLLVGAKSQLRCQHDGISRETGGLPPLAPQSQMESAPG